MSDQADEIKNFFPKGAIAFFLFVIFTMATIWLMAYGLMIARS